MIIIFISSSSSSYTTSSSMLLLISARFYLFSQINMQWKNGWKTNSGKIIAYCLSV